MGVNIGRSLAHATVPRIAYVLLVLLLAALGVGTARASSHTTRGDAYSHCESSKTVWNTWCAANYPNVGGQGPATSYNVHCEATGYNSQLASYTEKYSCKRPDGSFIHNNSTGGYHTYPIAQQCTGGKVHDPVSGNCVDPAARCLAKNDDVPANNTMIYTGQQCVDGCIYGARAQKTGVTQFGSASIAYGELGFTGETCPTNTPNPTNPNEERKVSCVPGNGGVSICSKPNGDTCYSATTGRFICWKPGETGEKSDGPVIQKRTAGDPPQNPPTPPPGETLTPQTPNTVTQTKPDGTANKTTTNNYTTVNGTNGTPTNSGEPNDGTGTPTGEGDGGDYGSVGGDAEFPRASGAEGRTAASITGAFKTRVSASPMIAAAQNFFTVQASGSCPVWTIPETAYTPAVVMDFWCVSEFSTTWDVIGVVCLIVFGWAAFRIAVL